MEDLIRGKGKGERGKGEGESNLMTLPLTLHALPWKIMKLKVAQVIGLNTDQKAAQVIYDHQDEDNSFFAVLELKCDDAFTKGRQALGELSDFYFDLEGEKSPAEKLKSTFEEVQKKLGVEEFTILLAAVSGKVLYLISKGATGAYLKRSEKISPLLSVGGPNQLISGFLENGDRVLLSTSSLISFLGDDLTKLLSLPVEIFEEEVKDRIVGSDLEDKGLACLELEIDTPPLVQNEEEQESVEPSMETQPSVSARRFSLPSVAGYFPKSNRTRLIIAIGLIIILLIGVGYKYKSSKDKQKQAQFNQLLQKSKEDFEAAKGLATLNPNDAKSRLDSAKDEVNKALLLNPKDSGAQNFKKQMEEETSSILLKSDVSDFPLFLDMDLVKKNFRGSLMSLSSGKLLLFDPAVKTLVSIDISKKSPQILAGLEQLGEAQLSSLNGGLAFIYSKDKGVMRVDVTNQKLTTVSKKDKDLGEVKDIYGFGSNIYLLDSSQIWKYLPTSEGYSDKREYLAKNTKADLPAGRQAFTNAIRMQIESSVYVLNKDGSMIRLTKGEKDNFSYSGLDKGVKDPKSFFVSSDTEDLYLLDSGNSRLLVLSKTGVYKKQISGEKFAQITDLVVDEKNKKVYLLDGSKIFQVDLK